MEIPSRYSPASALVTKSFPTLPVTKHTQSLFFFSAPVDPSLSVSNKDLKHHFLPFIQRLSAIGFLPVQSPCPWHNATTMHAKLYINYNPDTLLHIPVWGTFLQQQHFSLDQEIRVRNNPLSFIYLNIGAFSHS